MDTLQILRENINMHNLVNPWYCTISLAIQNMPENYLRRKISDLIFQTKYSRFRLRKLYLMWLTQLPIATTMLNVLSRHIHNLLLFFIVTRFLYVLISLVLKFILLRYREESIRKTFHDCKCLLLHSLLVFYILTKTRECWMSSSEFNLLLQEIPSIKYQTRFLE